MYKVLLVDDEPFILEGLREIIDWEEHGLEIAAVAADGNQALDTIERIRVHILLTDIKMPNMNGLELIRKIKQKGLDIKCIILSGYDDFTYVKEAARLGIENYLLKPVVEEELSSTVLSIVDRIESDMRNNIKARMDSNILKENILYRWVSGKISHSELSERSSLLGIDLNCNQFLVCVMRILKNEENNPYDSLMKFAILNICNELIAQGSRGIAFNDLNDDIVILLSGTASDMEKEKIREIVNSCVANISSLMKMNVFVSIGSIETAFMSVSRSFNNARSLMDYCLLMPPNSVVDYEESKKSALDRQNIIRTDFDLLKKLIISRKKEDVYAFIEDIFKRLNTLEGISPAHLQNILIEILYNISSIASSLKISTANLFDDFGNPFHTILQMRTMDDLLAWFKDIFNKIIDLVPAESEGMNPVIKRILNYIDANYYEDISLKTISSAFNINAAYLGQLFKNETGEMFSDYLNKIRIHKAKEMLRNTKLTINEIASKVGYINTNYFYSLFKKFTGENPTKYKRDIQL